MLVEKNSKQIKLMVLQMMKILKLKVCVSEEWMHVLDSVSGTKLGT